MKKNAKENFSDTLDDILSNSESGSKSFWQIMGRFMGKSQCSFKVPPLCNADDTYSFSDQDKATTLNDYFCSISTIVDLNIELPAFENRTDISLLSTPMGVEYVVIGFDLEVQPLATHNAA